MQFQIREANRNDINTIYDFIKGLAIYEKLGNEFIATQADLEKTIFDQKYANVLIAIYEPEDKGMENLIEEFELLKKKVYNLTGHDNYPGGGNDVALCDDASRHCSE